MKTILTLLALFYASFSQLTAQPLLNPEMFPLEGLFGERATPIDTLNSGEGPAGADVFWDFDHWTPDPETYINWFTSTLPYLEDPSAFPDATLGQAWYDTTYREEYYNKTPSNLFLVGTWSEFLPTVYNDPELLLVANMAYNDTVVDTYHATRQGADYDYVLEGVKWITYDAYGTLKIRGNTIPDVIRLRTAQTWRDTFYYEDGRVELHHVNRSSYQWYYTFKCGPDVAFHYTMEYREQWEGGVLVYADTLPFKLHKTMLEGCIHVGAKEPDGLYGVQFDLTGSNPVHDVLQYVVTGETAGRWLQLQVFDQNGRLMDSRDFATTGSEQRLEMPVAHYASGMYVVALSDGKGRVSKRWVKM